MQSELCLLVELLRIEDAKTPLCLGQSFDFINLFLALDVIVIFLVPWLNQLTIFADP